ncbi:unnamed protein product [Heterosigma akashiwo]
MSKSGSCGGDRAAADQPGAVQPGGHQAAEGRAALRAAGHGQDAAGARAGQRHPGHLPQGGGLGHCGQVHRRERPRGARDVRVRQGPPALRHLHGRGGRDRRVAVLGGHERGPRDPAHAHGAAEPAGRLRGPGPGEDGDGHEPAGHPGPCAAAPRAAGPQDRDPAAQRGRPAGHPAHPRRAHHQARRDRLRERGEAGGRLQRGRPAERVHGGGVVRDPRRARLCAGGGPDEGRAQDRRHQEAREQARLQQGLGGGGAWSPASLWACRRRCPAAPLAGGGGRSGIRRCVLLKASTRWSAAGAFFLMPNKEEEGDIHWILLLVIIITINVRRNPPSSHFPSFDE